jgi:ABC-2 type transport system ATP-binding protein
LIAWNSVGYRKKYKNSQREWRKKIQFVVCVLHKPKLILTNLSGFDPVNANIIKDEILALRDEGSNHNILYTPHGA